MTMRQALLAAALGALLLSGCTGGPPALAVRNETIVVPASPNYPGLVVEGTLDVQGDTLVVDAVARNDGNRTYRVEVECGPWQEEVYRGEERLPKDEPEDCTGFTLASLAPGTSLAYDTTWDGKVWDEGSDRRLYAPDGAYVWSIRFVAYHPDGVQLKRFDLDFNVTVG